MEFFLFGFSVVLPGADEPAFVPRPRGVLGRAPSVLSGAGGNCGPRFSGPAHLRGYHRAARSLRLGTYIYIYIYIQRTKDGMAAQRGLEWIFLKGFGVQCRPGSTATRGNVCGADRLQKTPACLQSILPGRCLLRRRGAEAEAPARLQPAKISIGVYTRIVATSIFPLQTQLA